MREGQAFEMVCTSFELAKGFFKENKEKAVRQFEDGKILFDPEGKMKEMQDFVTGIKESGRLKMTRKQIDHMHFEKNDQINAIKHFTTNDFPTANLYLQILSQQVLDLYFDMKAIWPPAPKQQLPKLREIDNNIAEKFDKLYTSSDFTERLATLEDIINKMFLR